MHVRRLSVVVLIAMLVAIALVVFPNDRPGPGYVPDAGLAADHTQSSVVTTTTTTIAPGTLPQTKAYPSATDSSFIARMRDLVAAAATDRPALGEAAFFPLDAYRQVKAIADPTGDWNLRLLANYDSDIGLVHGQLGADATQARFLSASVPSGATWVLPGAELNNESYWRVYGTVVYCQVGNTVKHFEVTSMISWRGEWYVVHLGVIR